mmetsp:Transcript_10735/g.23161  ORF Transcript_10735/g.23161 Transcript_10735/m.23161 type:complete len:353 (+) Transcript_10735:1303-2361(+)
MPRRFRLPARGLRSRNICEPANPTAKWHSIPSSRAGHHPHHHHHFPPSHSVEWKTVAPSTATPPPSELGADTSPPRPIDRDATTPRARHWRPRPAPATLRPTRKICRRGSSRSRGIDSGRRTSPTRHRRHRRRAGFGVLPSANLHSPRTFGETVAPSDRKNSRNDRRRCASLLSHRPRIPSPPFVRTWPIVFDSQWPLWKERWGRERPPSPDGMHPVMLTEGNRRTSIHRTPLLLFLFFFFTTPSRSLYAETGKDHHLQQILNHLVVHTFRTGETSGRVLRRGGVDFQEVGQRRERTTMGCPSETATEYSFHLLVIQIESLLLLPRGGRRQVQAKRIPVAPCPAVCKTKSLT